MKFQHTISKIINDDKSAFWILDIIGWVLYFFFLIMVFTSGEVFQISRVLWCFFTALFGFSVTLLFSYLFKTTKYKSMTYAHQLFFAVTIIIITANIWVFYDTLIQYLVKGIEVFKLPLSIWHHSFLALSYGFLLFIWFVFYQSAVLWKDRQIQKEIALKATMKANNFRLQMLQYQLNPHFLFNSLNSIMTLIDENKTAAKETLSKLSDFLRFLLLFTPDGKVKFLDELNAIKQYLSIQKIQYEDRLSISYSIDPSAKEYPILSFLIHPLVENAIKFGMQTSSTPLYISIEAAVQNDSLHVNIKNSGNWVKESASGQIGKIKTGIGLENIKQRLEKAYYDNHSFIIEKQDNYVEVKLKIKDN